MKKLAIILVLLALTIGLGYESPDAGNNWRRVVIADSVDATRDTTIYWKTGAYSRAFYAILWGKNTFTGATDGHWNVSTVLQLDERTGGAVFTEPLWGDWLGQTCAVNIAAGVNDYYCQLSTQSHSLSDGEMADFIFIIPADSLKFDYSAQSVTGGLTHLILFYQIIE